MSSKHHLATPNAPFLKEDIEKLKKLREHYAAKRATEAEQKLREAHFMRCGKCGHTLVPKLFHGVEIDVCTHCGAVLLDQGELEQLTGETGQKLVDMLANLFGFTKGSAGTVDDAGPEKP